MATVCDSNLYTALDNVLVMTPYTRRPWASSSDSSTVSHLDGAKLSTGTLDLFVSFSVSTEIHTTLYCVSNTGKNGGDNDNFETWS